MKKILLLLIIAVFMLSCESEAEKQKRLQTEAEDRIERGIKYFKKDLKKGMETYVLNAHINSFQDFVNEFPNSEKVEIIQCYINSKDSILSAMDSMRVAKKEKKRIKAEKANLETRKTYASTLRNYYLDQGLDIKVKVSGKNYDKLTLTYALFNDVWFRKFETNGDFKFWMNDMGFQKVTLSDNYNYNKYKHFE